MKKWMYNALIVLFALIFLCSAVALGFYYWDSYNQENRYDELASLRPTVQHTVPVLPEDDDTEASTPVPAPADTVTVTNPSTGETLEIQAGFEELYNMNSDIIGWLTIPGVEVDYPVMHTPDDPEYYLRRNFDGEKQTRGCLFLQGEADALKPSDNLTIYGHRMRDGTMFGQLQKYKKQSFFAENRYIYFDTLTENRTYEIVAVFMTNASAGEGFAYHTYVDMTMQEFVEFDSAVMDLALYDTGVDAVYGDKLLTLSTCDYYTTNGRLVVVAKQVAASVQERNDQ